MVSYTMVQELAGLVTKKAIGREELSKIRALHTSILSEIHNLIKNAPKCGRNQAQEIARNIESIIEILDVRIDELEKQQKHGQDTWQAYSPAELYEEFWSFLDTVEKNSNGAYRIISNIVLKNDHSYYINLNFETSVGEYIYMPLLVKDVIRDLIANSRKYTGPGGNIMAGVLQDEEYLTIVVEDNGRGIPKESIGNVVDFGMRAHNTVSKKSYGGGFGLTKAYFITKKCGGRMWIESEVNYYTRVRIRIPFKKVINIS